MLYREGVFNIHPGWSRTERISALLNQEFIDQVQNSNFCIACGTPPCVDGIDPVRAHIRQLGDIPIAREPCKIFINRGLVRPSQWRMVTQGLEGLKNFRLVIIDVTYNWDKALETRRTRVVNHMMVAILMSSLTKDKLDTELEASELELRNGRPCTVFYPLSKQSSESLWPSLNDKERRLDWT